jgi:putative inorganic carbon (HCO3(-)) transporter
VIRNTFIKLSLFYSLGIGFILLNLWFMVKMDWVLLNSLPFLLATFLVAIFSFDIVVYLIAFFAPLSIQLHEIMPGLGFDMYLPTEPLLFGLLVLFLLKVLQERGYDRKILLHPVSLAIYLNLFWILLTCLTSTMPLVSVKYLLSRTWFVIGLYFLTTKIFSDGKNLEKYVWLYASGLVIVIVYSTYRHLGYGLWDRQAAHYVVSPFFRDHTSYGAAIAMYLPFLVMFTFYGFFTKKLKLISLGMLGVFRWDLFCLIVVQLG